MKNTLLTVLFASLLPVALQACTDHQAATAPATPTIASTPAHDHHASATQAQNTGIWIDVRTAEEFNAGHLKNALNVPNEDIATRIAEIAPDKSQAINLYCRSGRRAEEARQTLLNMGYTNVTNHGGYEDLRQRGFE